jgi:hypothetical protein
VRPEPAHKLSEEERHRSRHRTCGRTETRRPRRTALLGARLTDPKDAQALDANLFTRRIKASVLLAPPVKGGAEFSHFAADIARPYTRILRT